MDLLKIFSLLFILSASCTAQKKNAECDYVYDENNLYTCKLTKLDINDKNDYFVPNGKHLQQHKNADVKRIIFVNNQVIRNIPNGMFAAFVNLEVVTINQVLLFEVDSTRFNNCENLEYLDLSHNIIVYIGNGIFDRCRNLKHIDLSYNDIDRIEENSFRNLNFLERLNLEENYLYSEHQTGNGVNSRSLHDLNLARNGITIMYSSMIANLSNLKELRLSDNNIQMIPTNFFSSSRDLKVLELDKNKLVLANEMPFQNLINLEYLNLEYNIINYIHCSLFASLVNLRVLKLNGNFILGLCPSAFNSLAFLRNLELSYNNFASLVRNPQIPLENLNDLEFLDLSYNSILFLNEGFGLSENVKMIKLFLNNNKIYYIHPQMFRKLMNLQLVDLSHNDLIKISDETFKSNQNMKTLFISNNKLEKLYFNVFYHMSKLDELDLSLNKIDEIDPLLPGFMQNKIVNLTENVCVNRFFYKNSTEIILNIALDKCIQNYRTRGQENIGEPTEPSKSNPPNSSTIISIKFSLFLFTLLLRCRHQNLFVIL